MQPKAVDGTTIFASGSIAQLQTALSIVFGKVNAYGVIYTSALNAPSVPDALAPAILAILDLQPEIHYVAQTSPQVPPIAPHGPPTNAPTRTPSAPPNNDTPPSPPAREPLINVAIVSDWQSVAGWIIWSADKRFNPVL